MTFSYVICFIQITCLILSIEHLKIQILLLLEVIIKEEGGSKIRVQIIPYDLGLPQDKPFTVPSVPLQHLYDGV